MIDKLDVYRHVAHTIDLINQSQFCELALVIVNTPESGSSEKEGLLKRTWKSRSFVLNTIYNRVDQKLFRTGNDPFGMVNIGEKIEHCEKLNVVPLLKKFSDSLTPEDIETIHSKDLDVIVRFGFRILRGQILKTAKYGVWSFHHADNSVNRGGPAGFWEVMLGLPTTGTTLQVLTEDLDGGKVIAKSWSRTDKRSVARNKSNFYAKSPVMLLNALKYLSVTGEIMSHSREKTWTPYSHKLFKAPKNWEMFRLVARLFFRYLSDKIRLLFMSDQWILMYHFGHSVGPAHDVLYQYKKIVPPKDRFWADPFPVYHNGEYFIFLEEYLNSTKRGRISVMRLQRDGSYSKPEAVLEKDYHLSYPNVFQHDGSFYMIPETKDAGRVELYRCTEFPLKWELDTVLVENVKAVDPTIYYDGSGFYLFLNRSAPGGSTDDELSMYHSSNLRSTFLPFKFNPVVSDCRKARPAGSLFRIGNDLYRPSQISAPHYGYGISINKIEVMNENEFREQKVSTIEPLWDDTIISVHTINKAEKLSVLDGVQRRAKWHLS